MTNKDLNFISSTLVAESNRAGGESPSQVNLHVLGDFWLNIEVSFVVDGVLKLVCPAGESAHVVDCPLYVNLDFEDVSGEVFGVCWLLLPLGSNHLPTEGSQVINECSSVA